MNLAVNCSKHSQTTIKSHPRQQIRMARGFPTATLLKVAFYLFIDLLHFIGGAAKMYLKTAAVRTPWMEEVDDYLDPILLFIVGFDGLIFIVIPLSFKLYRELKAAYAHNDDESESAGEVERFFSAISALDNNV